MKAMRVGAHYDGPMFVLDEDNKIHCIKPNDITIEQQQEGAKMKVDRVIEIGGFGIALLLLLNGK